jgi:hypothetical protein
MMFSIKHWRARHLLSAWITYWVGLTLVAIGPALLDIWQLSRTNAKGNASAAFTDGRLALTVQNGTATSWSGTVSLLAALLWIAVPPLVLWIGWMVSRPAPGSAATERSLLDPHDTHADASARALHAASQNDAAPIRREPAPDRRPTDRT